MAIRRIPMSLNLVVRQNLWASVPYIDVQIGVKHGNPADSQVEKSGQVTYLRLSPVVFLFSVHKFSHSKS